jgi:hypothetical protein
MMGLFGKKNFVTIDHATDKRNANEIPRERLLRIALSGEKKADAKNE